MLVAQSFEYSIRYAVINRKYKSTLGKILTASEHPRVLLCNRSYVFGSLLLATSSFTRVGHFKIFHEREDSILQFRRGDLLDPGGGLEARQSRYDKIVVEHKNRVIPDSVT
jgi:hypothetical protein